MIESKKSPPTMWDAHGGTDLIWETRKPAAIVTELMNLVKRAGIHLKRDHPECSKMMKAEDKVKGILPMAFKRLGQTVVTKVKKD